MLQDPRNYCLVGKSKLVLERGYKKETTIGKAYIIVHASF